MPGNKVKDELEEEALRKQNRELAFLNKATQKFISTLDLNQVLINVLTEMRDLLEVTEGSAWLVDPKTNELVCWRATNAEHTVIHGWRLAPRQGIAGWVVEHCQSVIVPDTRTDPRHFKGIDQKTGVEIRSILCVPLFEGQEVIGVLQMVDTVVNRFRASDMELVELLATTATIAIENASLFQALLDNEKRYHSLFENTPISLLEEDFSAVKTYLETLRQSGIHDFRSYFQQRPEAILHCVGLIKVVDVNKATLDLYQVKHKGALLGSLSKIIVNADLLTMFSDQLEAIAASQPHFASEVSLRTLSGSKIYVDFSWSVAPGYEKTYQKVIVCLRNTTERTQAEKTLRRYTERLKIMHEIDRAILTAQSTQAIVQAVSRQIRHLIPCQRVSVVIFDPEGQEMLKLVVDANGKTQLGSETYPLLEDFWLQELDSGKVQVIEDTLIFSQSATIQSLQPEGMRSLVIVPLLAQNQLMGVLTLGMNRPYAFAPEDVDIAREVADSLAVAIQQARLYEAERHQREVAETLRQAGAIVTATLQQDEAIRHILEQLERVVPYDSASVQLLREGYLEIVGGGGWSYPTSARGLRFPVPGNNPNTLVIQQRRPYILNNVRAMASSFHEPHHHIQSWLGAPLIIHDQIIGMLTLDSIQPNYFTSEHATLTGAFAGQVAVALENARLFEQVRAGHKQLQTLSHRLVEVQEAERRHIAREFHDEIGQLLTGLKLMLELSTRLPADAARKKLDRAQELVSELMERVEELSLNLRPAMLDDLGLLYALLWHFERYTKLTQIQVAFEHVGLERRFQSDVETAAYRIVQEALTNVARYARVSEVSVQLYAIQDSLYLQIMDQGAGFDLEATRAAGKSSGLTGMYERAILVGGHLTIESTPGAGVRLMGELPLANKEKHDHNDNYHSSR